jgi:predicted outer membrane repeat protein
MVATSHETMPVWRKVVRYALRFVLSLLFGVLVIGVISYCSSQSPLVMVAPITLEWHTGSDKPVILFVHGLGGEAYETWNQADSSFMQLMARDPAFADYGIVSVQYPSSVFWRRPSIQQLSKKFGECLKEKFPKSSHIVIVAHSLGGIVARQGLILSELPKRPHQFVTLITLASPFQGSELSNFTAGLAATGISSRQLSGLGVDSELLDVFESNWTTFIQSCGPQIRQFAASEGRPIAGMMVVQPSSATKGVPRECTFQSAQDTHLTIAKPASLETPIGSKVREWVLLSLKVREFGPGERIITQDLEIPAGQILRVQPAATLIFRKGARILAKGRIEAKGTNDNPINFYFDSAGDAESGLVLRGVDAAESQFVSCNFRGGKGIGVKTPNPARQATVRGKELYAEKEFIVTTVGKRHGGALLLIGATTVSFTNCTFTENQAYIGGAMALFGSDHVQINHCVFKGNTSRFGGGAIFAQASEVYITGKCEFGGNRTGETPMAKGSACGVREATFLNNEASNAGGALYILNTHPSSWNITTANQMSNLSFIKNRSYRPEGWSFRIDGETKTRFVDTLFEDNSSGADSTTGLALKDESRLNGQVEVLNATWRRNGVAFSETYRTRSAPSPGEGGRKVVAALIQNHKNFKSADQRIIDTIVVHSISASNCADTEFRTRFADELKAFESSAEIQAVLANSADVRFDWRFCKLLLELHERSAHYLIDRSGVIRQLVADKDIAFHAGKSVMLKGDDRRGVDDFSIGIEMIGSDPQTDDNPSGEQADFTQTQYGALDELLVELSRRHHILPKNIVAYGTIVERASTSNPVTTANANTNPAQLFDLPAILGRLDRNLNAEKKIVVQSATLESDIARPQVPDL